MLQGVTEPYRMLTARSEHRLALRADNAGLRLTAKGSSWGCVGPDRAAMHAAFRLPWRCAGPGAAGWRERPAQYPAEGAAVNQDGRWRHVLDALALPAVDPAAADRLFPWLRISAQGSGRLEAQALYAPYLERQAAELRLLEREEKLAIPPVLDFAAVPGCRRKCGSGWPRPAGDPGQRRPGCRRHPGSPGGPRGPSAPSPRWVSRETPGWCGAVFPVNSEKLRAYLTC